MLEKTIIANIADEDKLNKIFSKTQNVGVFFSVQKLAHTAYKKKS